jgi:hypothetical protein
VRLPNTSERTSTCFALASDNDSDQELVGRNSNSIPVSLENLFKKEATIPIYSPSSVNASNGSQFGSPVKMIGAIDEQLQRDLMTQFRQACQLGDADDALECLNKLQESDYSSDKLVILKRYIERYDFDNALANAL